MKQDNQREAFLYSYLAGIIDGEGTIRIGLSNKDSRGNVQKCFYASISVGMTDYKVIKLLSDTFGSSVRKESVLNRKLMFRWGTSGNKVVPKIIEKIIPYLIVKKEQAELVIKFCETFKDKQRNIKCSECGKIKKIQGRGLCGNCYMKRIRHNLEMPNVFSTAGRITINELQHREELYLKVRKLNAVGALATTKSNDTREGEAIV